MEFLQNFGGRALGFLTGGGRRSRQRKRGRGRGTVKTLRLMSGAGGVYFTTKSGSSWGTDNDEIKASIYRRNSTPQYICKFYKDGSLVGGTISYTGHLAGLVAAINATSTGSLNTHMLARLIEEVNGVFQASNSLAKSVAFQRS